MNSWKAFLHLAGCGSIFPSISCRDAWRSGSELVRGQVNMADEAKLLSAFEALVVQHAVKRDCGEELGPFCYQYLLLALQFWVHLIDLLSILPRCNGFARIQKAVMDHTSSRPPNSDHDPLFGASLGLGSALELFLRPPSELVVSDCRIKSTFRCTSQSSREMVPCCWVD